MNKRISSIYVWDGLYIMYIITTVLSDLSGYPVINQTAVDTRKRKKGTKDNSNVKEDKQIITQVGRY
jgi:hypothetical protein